MWTAEERKAYHHEHRELMKKLGRCVRCGHKLTEGDKHLECEDCRQKQRAATEKQRQERKAAGRCPNCAREKPDDGFVLCEKCRAASRKSRKTAKERWAAAGLCLYCGGERDSKFRWCSKCRKYRHEITRRYIYGGANV